MHLKVKIVKDIWDHDPGVDLADVTLQLGKIETSRNDVILRSKNEEPQKQSPLKTLESLEEPEPPEDDCGASVEMDSSSMNTFPRSKKDADRKYRFLNSYSFNFEKHKKVKEKIAGAIERKNVFQIVGPYPALRKALRKRNWIEKAHEGNEYEEALITKILRPHNADFIWQNRNTRENKKDASYTPYRSRIYYERSSDFTMKEGLVKLIDSIQWSQEEGIAELDCPRTHLLNSEDAITRFLEDFQLTTCTSFLYHLNRYLDSMFNEDGTKSVDIVHTAMSFCRYHMACARHEDIDYQEYCEPLLTPEDRSTIMEILRGEAKFAMLPGYEILSLVAQVKKLVLEATRYFQDMKIDGVQNVWILKPGNRCRGLGIMLFDDDRKLLDFVDSNPDQKYVAQKYIERPMLIHNTKFDIRQYFLVTFINNQLKIWMYHNCYLRFSSREFNLDDFNESIHLTNYSIQKYYSRSEESPLPVYNMWSCEEFQRHLQTLGKGYYWERKIYPDMKKSILAVVSASVDGMKIERNMFELYGADFMVTENFRTMLLEINSSPDLSASTKVTETICEAVLEDLVKVIIDNSNDRRALTGQFECIWSLEIPRVAPYGFGISLEGKALGPKACSKSSLATGPPACAMNRTRINTSDSSILNGSDRPGTKVNCKSPVGLVVGPPMGVLGRPRPSLIGSASSSFSRNASGSKGSSASSTPPSSM
ncbi:tubulin glycylase 3B-like isoform X2 [Uranotaenia lowii]|uniref:tubulin glycylase 3B-like isoform X2 n=1 Tax=Uranotaenia lowii TaxID=190385 RepID=UPI002479298E|nr:tubulin glycylase 3B-like isoform X2 [Uranotaenia lowii]